MLNKTLISTERELVLQVSRLDQTIVYTLKPTNLFKLIWKLLRGRDIQFVAYCKEGANGRENSQNK